MQVAPSFLGIKVIKDRPGRTPQCSFCGRVALSLSNYIFAFESISLRDFLFCKRWLEVLEKLFSARDDCVSDSNAPSIFVLRWYIVTKGNSRYCPFGFCVSVRADRLKAKLTPLRYLSMMFSGYPLALRRFLNFKRPSKNSFFFPEELVLSNLFTSPLKKPYFTSAEWHEANCVNWSARKGF